MIILYLILIALGAVCYRLGGASYADFPKLPKWLIHSYTRDIGVPLIALASMVTLGKYHWALWLCMPLMYGALTTYWDFMFNDVDNFYMHGFMCGVAMFPLVLTGFNWQFIFIRAIILGMSMGLLNKYANKWHWKHAVIIEECSRGALLIATLWMI